MRKATSEILIEDFLKNEFVIKLGNSVTPELLKNLSKSNKERKEALCHEDYTILELFNLYTSIDKCLKSIEIAKKSILHYCYHDYIRNDAVAFDDFCSYHLDVVYHKVSTLKDLYFKIINTIYSLGLTNEQCTWEYVGKAFKNGKINNKVLSFLLAENFKRTKHIRKKRNESAHEGTIIVKDLEEIICYDAMAFLDSLDKGNVNLYDKKSICYENLIENTKQKIANKIEEIECFTYNMTFHFFNSLITQLDICITEFQSSHI